MISTELQSKIDASISLIRRSEPIALKYQPFGAVVAFSGGKDSVVLAQLVKESGVRHRLIHNLTTIDPPEVVRYIRDVYPDCIIRRPKRTFWQICEHHRLLPSRKIRFCCKELKEQNDPLTLTFTGVRRGESAQRAKRDEVSIHTRRRHPNFVNGSFDEFENYRETEVQCIRGLDKLVVNPILNWSEDDVWNFIEDRQLSVCELYHRGYKRIGCLFCPLSNERNIDREVLDYPKYYQAYLRMIERILEARRLDGRPNPWSGLTPQQVFDWNKSKLSLENYCTLNNITRDFMTPSD